MSERHFEDRPNKRLFLFKEEGWALWMAWDYPDDAIYWIDFRLFSIMGWDENVPLFHGQGVGCEPVIDHGKAEVVIHGFIKWDGCCQWWADCAHTDTKGGMEELCKVLREIYLKADEIMGLR